MTENTFNKMIKASDDSLRAFPSPNAYLWDQNFVNGQYVIAYEFDYGLDQNVEIMLPKVLILGRNNRTSAFFRWSFDSKLSDITYVNDN